MFSLFVFMLFSSRSHLTSPLSIARTMRGYRGNPQDGEPGCNQLDLINETDDHVWYEYLPPSFVHDSATFGKTISFMIHFLFSHLNISLSCMLHSFKSSAASTLVVASHIKSFIHGAFSLSAHEDHGKWSMVIYRQGFFPMWYSEYKLKRQLKRQNVFSLKDVMQNKKTCTTYCRVLRAFIFNKNKQQQNIHFIVNPAALNRLLPSLYALHHFVMIRQLKWSAGCTVRFPFNRTVWRAFKIIFFYKTISICLREKTIKC